MNKKVAFFPTVSFADWRTFPYIILSSNLKYFQFSQNVLVWQISAKSDWKKFETKHMIYLNYFHSVDPK